MKVEEPPMSMIKRVFAFAVFTLLLVACGKASNGTNSDSLEPPILDDTFASSGVGNSDESELPSGWFALTYQTSDLVCQEEMSYSQARCLFDYRNSFPSYISSPDFYCSNVNYPGLASCDSRWYPDELDQYEFVSFQGSDYVCDSTYSFGDLECYRYFSGDPGSVVGYSPDLYCTDGFSPECNQDFPPSDLEDLEFASIDGYDYVCESSLMGQDCYRWNGFGSPKDATFGFPDYYCNDYGECSPDDYP